MIILNAILHLFSFGNFYVHIVFFCFFSFLGLTGLFKAFSKHFPSNTWRLVFGIFLVPTVLFWTSTALKETLAIGILGLIIYISDFGLKRDLQLIQKLFILFLFLILFFLKIYVAVALIPVLLVNMIVTRSAGKAILVKYAGVFIFLFLFALVIKTINSDHDVLKIISKKQANAISEAKGGVFLENDKNFIWVDYDKRFQILSSQKDSTYKINHGSEFLSWKQNNMSDTTFITNSTDTSVYKVVYSQIPARSVIKLKPLKPALLDFVLYSPVAIWNVLFHPTIFEIHSWLHLIPAIENLWLLLLILLAILFYDKKNHAKKEIILFALIFSLSLFFLIGCTTPAIGAIIRYRTIGMVFFVPLCLLMIDEEKLKKAGAPSRLRSK